MHKYGTIENTNKESETLRTFIDISFKTTSDFHLSVILRFLVVSKGSGLYSKVRESSVINYHLGLSKSDHRINVNTTTNIIKRNY